MRSTLLIGLAGALLCLGACGDDEDGEGAGGSGNTGNTSSSESSSGGMGSGGEATGGTASGGEATGGDTTGGAGGDGTGGGSGDGTFGSQCAGDEECNVPLVCFTFGMGQMLCTKACTSDEDCAPESNQCNGMGFCKAD